MSRDRTCQRPSVEWFGGSVWASEVSGRRHTWQLSPSRLTLHTVAPVILWESAAAFISLIYVRTREREEKKYAHCFHYLCLDVASQLLVGQTPPATRPSPLLLRSRWCLASSKALCHLSKVFYNNIVSAKGFSLSVKWSCTTFSVHEGFNLCFCLCLFTYFASRELLYSRQTVSLLSHGPQWWMGKCCHLFLEWTFHSYNDQFLSVRDNRLF